MSDATLGKKDLNLVVGAAAAPGQGTVTARKAAGLTDMMLPVSPAGTGIDEALENLCKAINLALQTDFLETDLDNVYEGARVQDGLVRILHRDYIGFGDGIFAVVGRAAKSIQLTLRGPDAASPLGKSWFEKQGAKPASGFFNLLARKLDLVQEFEDKVPVYVQQMLDRLEAARMITGWNRTDWDIRTDAVGLDVTLRPRASQIDKVV